MRPLRLCVFVKAPEPGKVKGRLAVRLGARQACAAYEELAEHCLAALSASAAPKELWVAGGVGHRKIQMWAQRFGFPLRPQPAGDLGARMLAAIESCRQADRAAMVVGSDLPELNAAYVAHACAALRSHDVVLGPAEDGGYGLIGMHEPMPELFADMPWGTPLVLSETRRRAARLGLRLAQAPLLWDVDDLADWRRFRALKRRLCGQPAFRAGGNLQDCRPTR